MSSHKPEPLAFTATSTPILSMSKTHDTNPSPVLGYKSILAAAVTTCPKEACATDGALIKPLCRRSIPEPSALTNDQEVEKREEDIQYNATKTERKSARRK